MVTSPVYVGAQEQVDAATKCQHEKYKETTRTVAEGVLSLVEKCETCVAVRSRFKHAETREIEEWATKRAAEQTRMNAEAAKN